MYLMSGCTTDPRILGTWKEKYSGNLYLSFASNGTLSVYESDTSCSNYGIYLYVAGPAYGRLALRMIDNVPACWLQYDSGFLYVVFQSDNEFEIGIPMMGSDLFCRTDGIGEPCIE
jgi:hypothetical protein